MASTKAADQQDPQNFLHPYEEPPVRAPDASNFSQLVSENQSLHSSRKRPNATSVFAIGGSFKAKTPKDATLERLYERPTELMFTGTFYELRQKGKTEDKWLLINIQRESEFKTHVLNRDVWSDECIQDMIDCHFIFWQHQDCTEEGTVYSERYNVQAFPHIAILDPRTGGLLWSKEHVADKTYLAERLQDFIHDNPSPSTSRIRYGTNFNI